MSTAPIAQKIFEGIGAHGAWKHRLRMAIRTKTMDISPATAACDNACEFGKWLYGPQVDAATRAGIPYQVVRRLHADFHRSAGNVLSLVQRGDDAAAQQAMDHDFQPRSEKLVVALNKWRREVS